MRRLLNFIRTVLFIDDPYKSQGNKIPRGFMLPFSEELISKIQSSHPAKQQPVAFFEFVVLEWIHYPTNSSIKTDYKYYIATDLGLYFDTDSYHDTPHFV